MQVRASRGPYRLLTASFGRGSLAERTPSRSRLTGGEVVLSDDAVTGSQPQALVELRGDLRKLLRIANQIAQTVLLVIPEKQLDRGE